MKKNMLRTLVISAVVLALMGSGCVRGSNETQSNGKKQMKVGFSMATLLEDRWLRDRDIFLAKAQQRGMEVIVRNANMNSDVQYEQVKQMLEQDIDVLVIAPNDTEKEAICVQAAKAAGVPVVVYDRLIQGSDADVYVAFDNFMIGQLMGQYMIEHAPTGGYLLVNGPKTDHNSLMIREGYMSVLQPHLDDSKIEILSEIWAEGWVREKAYDFVLENIPSLKENITAAICENDSLAWGVTDAFSEARIENVVVVGMDADLSACQRIATGRQGMTIYKPIQNLVTKTLDICEILAAGQALETKMTLSDGTHDVPYVALSVFAVTDDNLDETVIADGFHLKEEVYEH